MAKLVHEEDRPGRLRTGIAIAALAFGAAFTARECMTEGREGIAPGKTPAVASEPAPTGQERLKSNPRRRETLVSQSAVIDSLFSMFPRNSLDCQEVPVNASESKAAPAASSSQLSKSLTKGVEEQESWLKGRTSRLFSCMSELASTGNEIISLHCKSLVTFGEFENDSSRPTIELLNETGEGERVASFAAILNYMEYIDPQGASSDGLAPAFISDTYGMRDRYARALADGNSHAPDISCIARRMFLADLAMQAAIMLGDSIMENPGIAESALAAVPESRRQDIMELAMYGMLFYSTPDYPRLSELFSVLSWANRAKLLDAIHGMDADAEGARALSGATRQLSNAAPELKDAIERFIKRGEEESEEAGTAPAEGEMNDDDEKDE